MKGFDIQLVSEVYRVTGIVKKTKARLFGDIRVGDHIRFKYDLEYAGRSSRGAYASWMTFENVTQGTEGGFYVSDVTARLRHFELERVEVAQ